MHQKGTAANAQATLQAMANTSHHLPIILIHGMHARDKNLTHSDLWGRIPDALTDKGFSIWYGNEDAWGNVERNAREIVQSAHIAFERTGAPQVHVIAHSKGGFDAYCFAHQPEMEGRIASILTLAAPMRGMNVSRLLLAFGFFIKPVLAPAFNRTARDLGDVAPDSYGLLKATSPHSCKVFLQKYPPIASIPYRSLAFVPHPGKRFNGPRSAFISLFDGQNDGIAPLASTEIGDWYIYDAEWGKAFNHDDSCDLLRRDVTLTERGTQTVYPSIVDVVCTHLEQLDAIARQRLS